METGFQRKQKFLTENPHWNDEDYNAVEGVFSKLIDSLKVTIEQIETMSKYGCQTSDLNKLRGFSNRLLAFVTSEENRRNA